MAKQRPLPQEHPRMGEQQKVHWKVPFLMYTFFVVGIGIAIGHHFFYAYLDESPAESQDWMIRAGTALATLARISLSAAIGFALAQRTWSAFRKEFISLGSIDSLIAITSNPLNLFNLELLRKATLAFLLGLTIWLSPLISVFAPGSLTVLWHPELKTESITIDNLNFSIPAFENFGDQSFANTSMLFDWSYDPGANPSRAPGGPVYQSASSLAAAIVYQSAYGGGIMQASAPPPCEGNCTFAQSFTGPAYKCTPREPLNDKTLPYYSARNSTADWCVKYSLGADEPCLWAGSGDNWMDGVILIDYIFVPTEHRENISHIAAVTSYTKYAFRCEQWRTRFDIRRTFRNHLQSMAYNYTYLDKIPYWPISYRGQREFEQATSSNVGPPPLVLPSNFTGDSSVEAMDTVGYAIHQVLYDLLGGVITVNAYGLPYTTARIGGTNLVEPDVWPPADGIQKPKENFGDMVEQLSRNITLSLFSIDDLVYRQPQDNVETTIYPYKLVFRYDRWGLWLTYGIAIGLTAVGVSIGTISLITNGVSMDTGFLTIMTTTRGPMMDSLAAGHHLGSQPMPDDLARTEVMFGYAEDALVTESGNHTGTYSWSTGLRAGRGDVSFGIKGRVRKLGS